MDKSALFAGIVKLNMHLAYQVPFVYPGEEYDPGTVMMLFNDGCTRPGYYQVLPQEAYIKFCSITGKIQKVYSPSWAIKKWPTELKKLWVDHIKMGVKGLEQEFMLEYFKYLGIDFTEVFPEYKKDHPFSDEEVFKTMYCCIPEG